MSSENEEVRRLLLAKQNPDTGASLLRKLSRAQLQLWQEIGRKGLTIGDLAIRHVGRDMLSEVRALEEHGVVILQELDDDQARESFSAHGQTTGPAPEDEVDPRVRRPPSTPRRNRRSTAAIEKSKLDSKRKGRPTEPTRSQDVEDDTKEATPAAATRPRRSTAAIEKTSLKSERRGRPTGPMRPQDDEADTKETPQAAEAAGRPKRATAAIEKSNLKSERRGRPTGPMRPQDDEDATKETPPVAAKRHKRPLEAVEMPARNPKSARKNRTSTAAPPKDSFGDKTVKSKAAAPAARPRRPTAAIEKKARRKAPSTAPVQPESLHEKPAAPKKRAQRLTAAIEKPVRQRKKKKKKPTIGPRDAGPAENPGSPADMGSPIDIGNPIGSGSPEGPGRSIDLGPSVVLGPSIEPGAAADAGGAIDLGASFDLGPPLELGSSGFGEAPPQQPSLEKWAENASVTMGQELQTPALSTDSIGEWGPRGTKTATKPAMPSHLSESPGRSPGRSAGAPSAGDSQSRQTASFTPMDLRGESLQTRGSEAATKALSLELDGDGLTMEETALMKLEVDLSKVEKRRVIDVARAVKSGDICGLLGLPSTAERKEVKRAYFALSQELHPDQYFGRKIGGFKPLLEQAFTSLAQFVKALNDKRTTLPNSYRTSNNARRMSQRFHLTLRAQVQCDSWNAPEWTETQDISAGGAFLITNLEAVMGEPIRLNVESPNGTIGILGVVVSIRESDQARRERRNSGLGIQFRKAAALDSQRLAELIAEAKRQTPAFTASAPIKSLEAQRLAKRSKARGRKDHIIGIDLGTTNTAVSAVVDNHVQIVPWPDGTYSVPSVVAFPERGRCVVGYEAQKHLLTNPRNVVNSGKRLVGRQFDDPEIASFMAEARFKNFKGPDGTVVAQLQGEDYAIPQICSYLFSAAKHAAAATLGSEPTKAVLTVPVSYDQKQIESVRRSAKLAQLDVIEIIEEPCAAAIANQGQKDFKGIVGVYDFGGGTFDFSLVEAGAGDLRVLATTGDSWLGGDDFDLAIAEAAASMFWKAEGVDLHQKAVEWQYLIYACEKAKRELSSQDYAQVLVPEVARNAQGTVDLRINLARQKVELLWAEPIRRSIDTCKQALSLAGVSMTQLSAIYMSGGTSYIPAIRRNLMKSFGVPVHLGLAPEHAVCAGAGIRAAILQGR